jgi:dynein heavy chain
VHGFTTKIRELYEMVLVRHGVMICGQTLSGKTASIHTLKQVFVAAAAGSRSRHALRAGSLQAMTACSDDGIGFHRVHVHTINPKSVTAGQLYGNFDENTHEWSDGILAVLYRQSAKDTSPDLHWILFDGPVDAVWVENMNTVLDDNKKLCLNSGTDSLPRKRLVCFCDSCVINFP